MGATNLHPTQNMFFAEENKTPAIASKHPQQVNVPKIIMYTVLHHSSGQKSEKMDLHVEYVRS